MKMVILTLILAFLPICLPGAVGYAHGIFLQRVQFGVIRLPLLVHFKIGKDPGPHESVADVCSPPVKRRFGTEQNALDVVHDVACELLDFGFPVLDDDVDIC